MTIEQWTPKKLQQAIEENQALVLLDVRQHDEFAYAHIAGSIHIPLNDLPSRVESLDPTQSYVLICHHGVRSQQACVFLDHQAGFTKLCNLQGGIDAWSVECDSSVKRY